MRIDILWPMGGVQLFAKKRIGEGLYVRRRLLIERIVYVVEIAVKTLDGGRIVVALDGAANGVLRGLVERRSKADVLLDLFVVRFFRLKPIGHQRLEGKEFGGLRHNVRGWTPVMRRRTAR